MVVFTVVVFTVSVFTFYPTNILNFMVYGHFGTKTLRHRCRSVRRTFRHQCGITDVVMLVNGGSYVVDGEGSLKQSTFMCRFLWIVGFEVNSVARWCDRNFCGEFIYNIVHLFIMLRVIIFTVNGIWQVFVFVLSVNVQHTERNALLYRGLYKYTVVPKCLIKIGAKVSGHFGTII